MDRHFLTPLFNPRSIIVFAGDPDAEPATREARLACLANGRARVFDGGHHLHMEQAARVAAPLLDFLG